MPTINQLIRMGRKTAVMERSLPHFSPARRNAVFAPVL